MSINKTDTNRFMTAWKYVDDIRDKKAEYKLRAVVIERYVESKVTTSKDSEDLNNAIKALSDAQMQEKLQKILDQKGASKKSGSTKKNETEVKPSVKKIKHDKEMVDYYCNDERDDARFMTAWTYISSIK
jgi:hypothetical protein